MVAVLVNKGDIESDTDSHDSTTGRLASTQHSNHISGSESALSQQLYKNSYFLTFEIGHADN